MAGTKTRGKKRQAKIDHLRACAQRGDSKEKLRKKVFWMKMDSRDAQDAIDGMLYG